MSLCTNNTIVALLTGTGRGAVASILVRGANAEQLVRERFQNKLIQKTEFTQNKLYFGTWRWNDYAEELVVCQTEEHAFEVHCHGGNVASSRIVDSLVEGGAEVVSSHDMLLITQSDKFARSAMNLLPTARTERVAALLLDQSRGALRQSLHGISLHLEKNSTEVAQQQLERLVELGKIGVRLDKPFSVVLIGPPNAGKSSLINAMLGYERSIVFDQPGTTRDLVRAETAVDGWPIRLTDTAGVRETNNQIEREGVRLAKQSLENCDLAIVVRDLTSSAHIDPVNIGLSKTQGRILIGTKSDLVADLMADAVVDCDLDLRTSATQNQGIAELNALIASELVPTPPRTGEAIPLDAETLSALMEAKGCIDRSSVSKAKSLLAELLA